MAPHVLIIGAGVSGLALAQGLMKHNISFHVYEKDSTCDYRAQGYRIRIAREAVDALKYLLTDETWALFELTCADMRHGPLPEVNATTAEVKAATFARGGPGGPNPQPGAPISDRSTDTKAYTVDRTMLREVLLRGLDGYISYGKALKDYALSSNGVIANFNDGTSVESLLVVGADGARSVVRKQMLPDHKILDTGGRLIYGKTPITPGLLNNIEPTLMQGMSAIKDRTRPLPLAMILEPITFPNRAEMKKRGFACPQDYLYWVTASEPSVLGLPEDHLLHMTYEEREKLVLDVTKQWHPSIRLVVENQAAGQTSVLAIHSCPPDFGTWEPNQRVTMLGDAVHLMGPTAGSGAITALRDAHHLCQLLVEEGQSKAAIGKYEAMMRDYASKIIEMSWKAGGHIFGQKSWDECTLARP